MDLSVCLIVKNEEKRLPLCLATLPKGCEIIVVDSASTDRTLEVAAGFGAQIFQRDFDNYAAQKNFAIEKANRKWVLSLDADETLTDQLRREITSIVDGGNRCDGYQIQRRLIFLGQRLRFGKATDTVLRLFKKGSGAFQNAIHEKFVLSSGKAVGTVQGEIEHYSYEDLEDYFSRFNRYTTMIAKNNFTKGRRAPSLFTMVSRAEFEFVKRYFLLLGFLDGYYGFLYAFISSHYVLIKYAKLREIWRVKQS